MEPELEIIFKKLKELIKHYSPALTIQIDTNWRYELWSDKEVEIEGRKKAKIFFAGLIIQKGYVGFYYMPVYIDTEIKKVFKPELLKLLKGKSCFHVKRLDTDLEAQIKNALEKGFDLYKKNGWV